MKQLIPDWALKIYTRDKEKIAVKNRLYGPSEGENAFFIDLMKWQYLVTAFDDETVQCMQCQIVAELLGLTEPQVVDYYEKINPDSNSQ